MKNQLINTMETSQSFEEAIFDEISTGNLCKIKIVNDDGDFPIALIKTKIGLTIIQKVLQGTTGIFIPEDQCGEIINILSK